MPTMRAKQALALVTHRAYGSFLFTFNTVSMTGGLLLRKRWKQAVWISSGLAFLSLLDWLSEKLAFRLLAEETTVFEVYPWLFHIHLFYVLIVVVTVGYFSLTVFRRQPVAKAPFALVAASLILATLALVSTYMVFPHALGYVKRDIFQGGSGYVKVPTRKEYDAIKFHKDITLKDPNLWGKPSFTVPRGAREINGVIRFEGRPAVTSVKLYLNDYWRTRTVKTDENGHFSFKVALDAPEVNRIDLAYWFNKPNDGREYMPILAHPALKYDDAFFDEARYQDRLRVSADKARKHADIEIEIVPFIDMIWPKLGDEEQPGSANETSLAWAPVAHASSYKVDIAKYGSDDSATPHLTLRVKANTIPLSDLPLKAASTPTRYYVDISAFDAKDRFLGTSRSAFGKMLFSIPGHEIIGNIANGLSCP